MSYLVSLDGKSITCLICGLTSYNPNDIVNRYCGRCHRFHEDAMAEEWKRYIKKDYAPRTDEERIEAIKDFLSLEEERIDATIHVPPDSKGTCDCCNAPDPEWTYPCEDFTIRVLSMGGEGESRVDDQVSTGDWAVCSACRVFVDANDLEGLKKRCLPDKPRNKGEVLGLAIATMQMEKFFRHRKGEPRKR